MFENHTSFNSCGIEPFVPNPRSSRGSSGVERIIGNDEVGSSILPRGTIF